MRSIMSTPMQWQQQTQQQVQQMPQEIQQAQQAQQAQQMPQQSEYESAVDKAISMAQNGVNLETEFRTQVSRNPDKAQAFAQFMQQNKGRNPWDIAYELMSKRGINPSRYGLPPRR